MSNKRTKIMQDAGCQRKLPIDEHGSLEGQLLVAMPGLVGSCFEKSVIYVCAHSASGAMGIIINNELQTVQPRDVLQQLHIITSDQPIHLPVHFGGPVDAARGFVLHSADYHHPETVRLSEQIAMTANVEVLRDIARGAGPVKRLLALGYAGWGAGQLEKEIEENSWLTVPASADVVFDALNDSKWTLSAQRSGIDLMRLSSQVGHA